MNDKTSPYSAEIAGALTPELEGAAHSKAHPARLSRPGTTKFSAATAQKEGPFHRAKRGE